MRPRLRRLGGAVLLALAACASPAPPLPETQVLIFGEQHDQPDHQRVAGRAGRFRWRGKPLGRQAVVGGEAINGERELRVEELRRIRCDVRHEAQHAFIDGVERHIGSADWLTLRIGDDGGDVHGLGGLHLGFVG